MNPETLFRSDLLRSDYQPPATPQHIATRYGLDPAAILKLDSGENPYGPSPQVAAALAAVDCAYYPEPDYAHLRTALAAYVGLPADYIAVSNGADEALDFLIRLCVAPTEAVLDCPPTFSIYDTVTRMRGGQVMRVPRAADFSLDLPAMLRALAANASIKLIFACTPNNPTGTVTEWREIRPLLDSEKLVVVDETYVEFQGRQCSLAPLVAEHPNLVVVRTFSKWAALAGLRLGYTIADPRVAAALMQIKAPYNVNRAAEAAALASLADLAYLDTNIGTIVAERARMHQELAELPLLKVYPSAANFLYIELDSPAVYEALLSQGILARYFPPSGGRAAAIRLTIGTASQNDAVIAALKTRSKL